ncbi:MAG: DUF5054 domain-containing protein [Verrucomicrobiota bacterium]|nr:DUF5054 domain-containing protein [Verrucomicrobiota bacterium]
MDIEPNKAAALESPTIAAQDATVKQVILICKNHLDVGFTESSAKVTHDAINWMLPVAIQQARELREQARGDNFVWTTPAWTIYEALERHRGDSLKAIERACVEGDIAWHALPFTTHTELMDEELFEFGLSLSQTLDARFGRRTIAAKMTDVPGHTRAIIPLMARAGVRFLHIGVNHMSAMPAVPPAFRWRDPETKDELVVYYSRGYGAEHRLAGHDAVLSFCMVGDNMEVPSLPDIRQWLSQTRTRYPDASVRFGRMDDYVALLNGAEQSLPVVEAEIGDTWIHGVGTDPWKVAHFRKLLSLRKDWLRAGKLLKSSPTYVSLSKPLLLVAEHTWGVAISPHLQDTTNFEKKAFHARRRRGNFLTCEVSWQEQRDYIEDAVQSISETEMQKEINSACAALIPAIPSTDGFTPINPSVPINAHGMVIELDPQTGAIFKGEFSGHALATGDHPLGLFSYQTMDVAAFDRYRAQYCSGADWAVADFGKQGMTANDAVGGFWNPTLQQLLRRDTAEQVILLMQLGFSLAAVERYGAPRTVWIELTLAPTQQRLEWDVQWFGKSATRIPEALWFSMAPVVPDTATWRMQKMNRQISPFEVVSQGARKLHAVECVRNLDNRAPWQIVAHDSPLVATGDKRFINFDDAQPNLDGGWHFNLWNNVWGTNFPQWYDQDARFRFTLSCDGM